MSEMVTGALEDIGDLFYDVAWYRLPPKQQIRVGLSIQRAQKNFRMTGLGLVECSLRVYATASDRFSVAISRRVY